MTEIPKIVAQRLQAVTRLGDHPDPDLLNAFVERSLVQRERVQILDHLAQCNNCREIVSLTATQPNTADAASVLSSSPTWLSWPVLRWGALVACVVVVGAVVTLHQKQEGRQTAASVAEEKAGPGPQRPAPNGAIEKVASLQVPNSDAKVALTAKQTPTAPKVGEKHFAAASSPIEMADARTVSPLAEMVPGRAKDAPAQPQDAQAEKAMSGSLAKKRSGMSAGAASNALLPANLAPRWTLSSDGTLQRSLDSGGTWQTIPVSSQTLFRALAANDLDIWVGGSGGALFHSSDAGQHWTQVRPVAEGEALDDDIIGVEFTDTLHGKLTTASEETWATADAGQSWQKQ
jgi:hypothetical protein